MSSHRAAFGWTEYLNLAREMEGSATKPPTREARMRSAVSRAYYAAFIQARNHLRDIDRIQVPRRDAHEFVIRNFIASPNIQRRRIGWNLRSLRDVRTHADYDDVVLDLPNASRKAVQTAAQVIAILANL
jgi:uncharacterized protein (UPF0332 family)